MTCAALLSSDPCCLSQECARADCGWYTSHYCEENTVRLCGHLLERAESVDAQLFVVFVSNQARQVPVWNQRLAGSRDEPVLWDYHGACHRWGVRYDWTVASNCVEYGIPRKTNTLTTETYVAQMLHPVMVLSWYFRRGTRIPKLTGVTQDITT